MYNETSNPPQLTSTADEPTILDDFKESIDVQQSNLMPDVSEEHIRWYNEQKKNYGQYFTNDHELDSFIRLPFTDKCKKQILSIMERNK